MSASRQAACAAATGRADLRRRHDAARTCSRRSPPASLHAEILLVISSNPQAGGLRVRRRGRHSHAGRSSASRSPRPRTISEAMFDALPRSRRAAGRDGRVSEARADSAPTSRTAWSTSIRRLIPAFCGQGFYGHHVHEAVLEYGAKISGCTVHFVDNQYDHGPIILQKVVPVLDDDTPDTLAARVFAGRVRSLSRGAARCWPDGKVTVDRSTRAVARSGSSTSRYRPAHSPSDSIKPRGFAPLGVRLQPDLSAAGIPHGRFQASRSAAGRSRGGASAAAPPASARPAVRRAASPRRASVTVPTDRRRLSMAHRSRRTTSPAGCHQRLLQELAVKIARVPTADAQLLPGKRPAAQLEPDRRHPAGPDNAVSRRPRRSAARRVRAAFSSFAGPSPYGAILPVCRHSGNPPQARSLATRTLCDLPTG